MKKDVLGIKIDDVSLSQAVEIVEGWLQQKGKNYITTPNPEIVMMAQIDQDLKIILNKSDLAVPDGRGLKLSGDIVCNTPGIDLMEKIIQLASEKAFTTGFLGGREEVAKQTADCLMEKYPKLKVTFAESGGEVAKDGEATSINIPKTDILFVAFGPPKQEKWIAKNLDKIPVKVAMGVGGAFDYISGKVPRAPIWVRNLGFEWLFRLIIEPRRIKRQLALIQYLFMVL